MDKKLTYSLIIGILIISFSVAYYFFVFLPNKEQIIFEQQKKSDTKAVKTEQENTVLNQSSDEYALMGKKLLIAFNCSTWADKIDDKNEAERLFLFGYEQGQKFLNALKAEKIKQEDISQKVPIGVAFLLQGPSNEFILGRIFQSAQNEALEDVFYTNYDRKNLHSEDLQKSIASGKFQKGNCQFLGK